MFSLKKLLKLFIFSVLILSGGVVLSLFFSCADSINEPVKEYFEYWTGTVQISRLEILSDYSIRLDGKENVYAKDDARFSLLLVNPQKYSVCPDRNEFEIDDANGNKVVDVNITVPDYNVVEISAPLKDQNEGDELFLKGNLKPAGMSQLWGNTSYSWSFIQNSPPDAVEELNNKSKEKIDDKYFFVTFNLPDQNLKRNNDIHFIMSVYLTDNGSTEKQWEGELTRDDNLNGNSSNAFKWYWNGQKTDLFYDYAVTVVDSTGLKSEIMATSSFIGTNKLCSPIIEVSPGLTGNKTADGYEYIEVENDSSLASYSISSDDKDAYFEISIDDLPMETVSAMDGKTGTFACGQHVISVVARKDGSVPATYIKKIIVVSKLSVTVTVTGENGYADGDTKYAELADGATQTSFNVYSAEQGATFEISVKNGGTTTPVSGNTGKLNMGVSEISVTVKKEGWEDQTFTYKYNVVKELMEPVFSVTGSIDTTDAAPGDENIMRAFKLNDAGTNLPGWKCTANQNETNSGTTVAAKIDGIQFESSGTNLALGHHEVEMTIKKDFMKPKTVKKTLYVLGIISKPAIKYTNEYTDSSLTSTATNPSTSQVYAIKYFEYENYPKLNFSITAKNGATLAVTGTPGNAASGSFETDSYYTIKAVATKANCRTETTEEKIQVKIKPINLYINMLRSAQESRHDVQIYMSGFGTDDTFDGKGYISLDGQKLMYWENSSLNITPNNWDWLHDGNTESVYSRTIYSPSDTLKLYLQDIRRNIGGGSDKGLDYNPTEDIPFSKLREGSEKDGWLYSSVFRNNGRSVQVRIKFKDVTIKY